MRPSGPIPASIAIVGEAPGAEEERVGEPFVGASGRLLSSALHGAGIMRTSCFITNVCRQRPPGNDISEWLSENKKCPTPGWRHEKGLWIHPHIATGLVELKRELEAVKPQVIIALGGTALWALTPHTGISKWRGSRIEVPDRSWTVVPSIHPAAVLRQPEQQVVLQMDLLRARLILEGKQRPRAYNFTIRPTFHQVLAQLLRLETLAARKELVLSCDVETRAGYTACIGLAWSFEDALCIPILEARRDRPFYWTVAEETEIRFRLYKLFRHPNILWVGQNFLYDCQYFVREGMGHPLRVFDTMIGHHSIYSNLRKGLDFLSSMYAHDHVYWKDESKDWDPALGEDQLWIYNCKDACITLECYFGILEQFEKEQRK